jgi:Ribosomal protein L1
VHAGIGRVSFDVDHLVENLRAFMIALTELKPSGASGKYIRGVSVSSSMGPGFAIDVPRVDPGSPLFFREEELDKEGT